jgi:hypothetical protein
MKKFLKSAWTISIGTALFSFLLTIIWDWIKGIHVLSTISNIFSTLGSWLFAFLNFNLKIWWVLSGIIILFLVRFIIIKYGNTKEQFKPNFIDYKEDKFTYFKWTWDWELNYDDKWDTTNLKAHCPKCDTPMNHDSYDTTYICPRCHFQSLYNNCDKEYEVKQVIIDNVKRRVKQIEKDT